MQSDPAHQTQFKDTFKLVATHCCSQFSVGYVCQAVESKIKRIHHEDVVDAAGSISRSETALAFLFLVEWLRVITISHCGGRFIFQSDKEMRDARQQL